MQQAFFISQTCFPHAKHTTTPRSDKARSRHTCYGYQDKWRSLDALWIPPLSGPLTQAPSDCRKKEHKGSTPGWSHPLQITICTRHLRGRAVSLEGKQTRRKWERVGKRETWLLSGLLVWLPQRLYTQQLIPFKRYGCKNRQTTAASSSVKHAGLYT